MSEQVKVTDRWLLKSIGTKLKSLRKQKSMSLDKLSRLADVSMRYVLQAEQGQANLSVLKLLDLANALSVDIKVFFENSHIGDLTALVQQKRIISFLGVRGAGKSSIATALLDRLRLNALEGKGRGISQWRLIELDRWIEEKAGLQLGQIFSMYGETHYRSLETECLNELSTLALEEAVLLITGGSIVKSEENYQRLKSLSVTIFLKAEAEDHWQRVIAQGDHRPMENHPKAFKELEKLLVEREPLYQQADFILNTHQKSITQCVTELIEALKL